MATISQILRKLKRKIMDPQICNCAYHEAGHAVYAYFVGWSVDNITIKTVNNRVIKGVTNYNFRGDTIILNAIEQNQINALTQEQKNRIYSIVMKRCTSLLGGPTSEAYYLNGIDFVGNLEIEFRGPDLQRALEFEQFVRHITGERHIVQEQLESLVNLTKVTEIWSSISDIADELIKSENLIIYQSEIEHILSNVGFFQFLRAHNL